MRSADENQGGNKKIPIRRNNEQPAGCHSIDTHNRVLSRAPNTFYPGNCSIEAPLNLFLSIVAVIVNSSSSSSNSRNSSRLVVVVVIVEVVAEVEVEVEVVVEVVVVVEEVGHDQRIVLPG